MKTKMLMLVLIAAVSAPLAAQDLTLGDIANQTGLTERQVRMVLGSRTAHAEYRQSFSRAERQLKAALGNERYQDLLAGRKVVLDRSPEAPQVASATTGTPRTP